MNNEVIRNWNAEMLPGQSAIGAALRRVCSGRVDRVPDELQALVFRLEKRTRPPTAALAMPPPE